MHYEEYGQQPECQIDWDIISEMYCNLTDDEIEEELLSIVWRIAYEF